MPEKMRGKIPKVALILLAILLPVAFKSNYIIYVASMVCIYCVITMALNLLMGIGGQTSLGNAGFAGIGAYTAAILSTQLDMPFYLCILCAGIVAALVGIVIGLPSVRLSGHYLAVATLGFGVAIPQIALKWEALTKGFMGINVPRASIFGLTFRSDASRFYLNLFVLILVYWTISNIIKSRFGRRFSAFRDSEIAAQSMGIRMVTNKTFLFSISAFYTGIAGAMYAYTIRYVSPNDFGIIVSFNIVTMIVLGGVNSMGGAITGAAFIIILKQFTNQLLGVSEIIAGALMVIILLFFPKGLAGLWESNFVKRIRNLPVLRFLIGGVDQDAT